jgi:hypothetical protein
MNSRENLTHPERTVHARNASIEVVRYDRAGKWYCESRQGGPRVSLTLDQAVNIGWSIAAAGGGDIVWGQPGGLQFDARLRKRLADGNDRRRL